MPPHEIKNWQKKVCTCNKQWLDDDMHYGGCPVFDVGRELEAHGKDQYDLGAKDRDEVWVSLWEKKNKDAIATEQQRIIEIIDKIGESARDPRHATNGNFIACNEYWENEKKKALDLIKKEQ